MNVSVAHPLPARRPTRRRRATAALVALLVAAPLVLLAALTQAAPARAVEGENRLWPGEVYTGRFGAPSVLRVGPTYYVYGTNTGGNNLPALTSTDLRTWRAREAWPEGTWFADWWGYNDAMPFPATWAAKLANGKPGVWAPAVAYLGGQYVDAYAVQMSLGSNRHCLTLATSPHQLGPFRDVSTKPFYCSSDPNGSIDPAWLQVGGKVYLIWKNAGVPGSKPTEILVRQMRADGLGFKPGTRAHVLLRTARPWEGNVIEAPSAIVYRKRIYLFYSGNVYRGAKYAIGYAICKTPLGRCRRGSARPLMATGGSVAGPGAQSPVVDKHGRLRLAYSAWDSWQVGWPGQRRLHVATLAVGRYGKLSVARRG